MKDEKNSISTEQVYGMFEELKEKIENLPASRGPDSATGATDMIEKKLDENKSAIDRGVEQVAALTNRVGQIDFRPVIQTEPPNLSGFKKVFLYIGSQQKQLNDRQQQAEAKLDKLQTQLAQMKTEVDTTEFKKLSDHTLYEMKQQIRYLKQPPIVLKIIIGMAAVALLATLVAGYYIRDRREWKDSAQYWYKQSQQITQPKTIKKTQ